ncbi:right-handed parallel beta-helix repeat-containing protein [Streptomyces thermocarboxydus]
MRVAGGSTLYLAGGGVFDAADSGLVLEDGGNVTVRDFRVERSGADGIVVDSSGELTANRTSVHTSQGHGVLLRDGAIASLSGCERPAGTGRIPRGVHRVDLARQLSRPGERGRWPRPDHPGERLAVEGLTSTGNGKRDAWGSGSAENTDPAGSGAADTPPRTGPTARWAP